MDFNEKMAPLGTMAIRVVEFSNGGGEGTKLERFLPKNQHNQRKLLNFEKFSKIRIFKVDYFDFSCKT